MTIFSRFWMNTLQGNTMAGETSKKYGDLGEDLSERFIKKFGWSLLTENVDFDCGDTNHKTDKGNENKTHGIDFAYSYKDPYKNRTQVVLVDSKALKNYASTTLGSKLSDYVEVLSGKIICSGFVPKFKEITGIGSDGYDVVGLIVFFIHDEMFSKKSFLEMTAKSNPSDTDQTKIFVLSNNHINLIGTMVEDLERECLEKKVDKDSFQFLYPDKELVNAERSWSSVLTLEMMFSRYIIAKVGNDTLGHKYIIYYFGSYADTAIKKLCSALARYQVFHFDNVEIVPLTISNAPEERTVFNRYFGNNHLEVSGQTKRIISRTVNLKTISFEVLRK